MVATLGGEEKGEEMKRGRGRRGGGREEGEGEGEKRGRRRRGGNGRDEEEGGERSEERKREKGARMKKITTVLKKAIKTASGHARHLK